MQEILTTKEVASYLKVSEATLYKLIKSGELPAFRIATEWRFTKEALEAWISTKTEVSVSEQIIDECEKRTAKKAVKHFWSN
jgi:excisionase family DNA binding protein